MKLVTAMNGVTDPYELILSKLRKKRRSGKGYIGLCPAHEDKDPTLSVGRGSEGRVLLFCHAGCEIESICQGFGIKVSDIGPQTNGRPKRQNPDWDIIATYDYKGCQHVRYHNHKFSWRTPVDSGGWRYGLYAAWYEQWSDGDWRAVRDEDKNIFDNPVKKPHTDARWFDVFTDRTLYKEESIREAVPGSVAFYLEGEKDVHTSIDYGFISTTAGSATDWRPEFAPLFAGLNLVIFTDNDPAGEKSTAKIAADCYEYTESIRTIRFSDLPKGGDLTDWKNAGGTREQLLALIEDAPLWEPELERDDFTEKAVQEAERAIQRSATEMEDEDSDPLLTEDKGKEKKLRSMAWDAARVVDMILLIMAALGFEGNHYRLINALIAFAKRLPRPLTYFTATHAQIYSKYRRMKTIKERSRQALVGSDITKLRDEMSALGYVIVDYVKGGITGFGTPDAHGYGSRFRLQILRFSLIAINLADRVRDEFKTRSQADDWAAQQVVTMIPRLEPVGKEDAKKEKNERKAQEAEDFERILDVFFKAVEIEFNRVVDREVAKPGDIDSLSEQVDMLAQRINKEVNKIGSNALCRGIAELAEIEQEDQAIKEKSLVHENMDQGLAVDVHDLFTDKSANSRHEDIRTSMLIEHALVVTDDLSDEFFETAVKV